VRSSRRPSVLRLCTVYWPLNQQRTIGNDLRLGRRSVGPRPPCVRPRIDNRRTTPAPDKLFSISPATRCRPLETKRGNLDVCVNTGNELALGRCRCDSPPINYRGLIIARCVSASIGPGARRLIVVAVGAPTVARPRCFTELWRSPGTCSKHPVENVTRSSSVRGFIHVGAIRNRIYSSERSRAVGDIVSSRKEYIFTNDEQSHKQLRPKDRMCINQQLLMAVPRHQKRVGKTLSNRAVLVSRRDEKPSRYGESGY
jgi:hypothetical protein